MTRRYDKVLQEKGGNEKRCIINKNYMNIICLQTYSYQCCTGILVITNNGRGYLEHGMHEYYNAGV